MTKIVRPFHTAPLGQSTLRFFPSPLHGADFPWHAHDDLVACLALPPELGRHFKRGLVSDWKGDVRTVATSGGIATIAPHFVAQGLIGAAIEIGYARQSFEIEYARAGVAALKDITAGYSFDEVLAFLSAAMKRNRGVP